MKELTDILSNATQAIERNYFHLEIDGSDPVYRERVYCYELYHQMRMRWPNNTKYCLNGEIDKAAHPILRKLGADHIKPDFLIHKPGHMGSNHAIIEVKTKNAPPDGIKKDLESLAIFINRVQYQRAIYLIYGYDIDPQKMFEKIQSIAEQISDLPNIEIWFHLYHSHPAFHFNTIFNQIRT
jgi:hypothetical protein